MVGRAFGSVQRIKGWHSTHMGKILNHMILLREENWIHEIRLTLTLVIKMHVPSQESERSCICAIEVLISPLFP